MNSKVFLKKHNKVCARAWRLARAKNHDYATAGNETEDALKNFRIVEHLGVCPASVGIFVRLTDKFIRVSNLLKVAAKVTTEKIEDTLLDIINYCIILIIELEDKKGRNYESKRGHKRNRRRLLS